MNDQPPGTAAGPGHRGKYARAEWERRFLLAAPPAAAEVLAARRITGRYLTGTRLRLRHSQRLDTGELELKFTQKAPAGTPGPVQSWITNTYLSPSEYDLLATLPAVTPTKTRFSVPPLGIDVFEGELHGLITAEAEFASDLDYQAFTPPPRCIHEITTDPRFTGGRLAHASRQEITAGPVRTGTRFRSAVASRADAAEMLIECTGHDRPKLSATTTTAQARSCNGRRGLELARRGLRPAVAGYGERSLPEFCPRVCPSPWFSEPG